jgi:hypothetical protein
MSVLLQGFICHLDWKGLLLLLRNSPCHRVCSVREQVLNKFYSAAVQSKIIPLDRSD